MPDLEALCRRWAEAEGLGCAWRRLPSGAAVVDFRPAGRDFVYSFFGDGSPGVGVGQGVQLLPEVFRLPVR